MSKTVNWFNPYARRQGVWLKGNLHTHSAPASGCANVPLDRMISLYVKAGYDFLGLSDHLCLSENKRRGVPLAFIPGVEWNSDAGEHTGVYALDPPTLQLAVSERNHDRLLRRLARRRALVILNHPNWQEISHYRREQLSAKRGFDGVEIYNAVIERLEGSALATDKWDYLLARGQRVLGFASDDAHIESDVALGWIVVRAPACSAAAIFEAMRAGNFYCSSGVTIRDVRRRGNLISVVTADAQEIQVSGRGGRRLARVFGRRMEVDARRWPADEYLRFTAFGQGAAMAWTQPFFVRG